MAYNTTKLVVVALLAVVLVIALVVDDTADWAGPLLALLIGYVVGNASVANVSPIIDKNEGA